MESCCDYFFYLFHCLEIFIAKEYIIYIFFYKRVGKQIQQKQVLHSFYIFYWMSSLWRQYISKWYVLNDVQSVRHLKNQKQSMGLIFKFITN